MLDVELRRVDVLSLSLVALTGVVAALAYPRLPEQVAMHWNAAGEVDGYQPRALALGFVVGLPAFMYVVMRFAPLADPRWAEENALNWVYDAFVVAVVAFVAYVQFVVLAYNLGYTVPIGRAVAPALGAVLVAAGWVTRAAADQPNWTVGVRTRWTLDDETVWRRANELGGAAFYLAGISAGVGGYLFPRWWFVFVLTPTLAAAAVSVGYSYLLAARRESNA